MFKSKNFNSWVFYLAIISCGVVLGVGVKTGLRSKVEGVRTGQAYNQGFMAPASGIVRLVSLASRQIGTGNDDVRRRLQQIYISQIGVRERTGKNDGAEVGKYLVYTGIKTPSAWCAAFVSWTFQQAGFNAPKTAWSPALFPKHRLTSHPKTGDVFGIYFPELKRIAHCGFVDEWSGIWCITVEGNTNNRGSISTRGDIANPIRAGPGEGVYRKKRLIKTIKIVADWVSK